MRYDENAFLVLDEEFHVLIAKSANLPIVARLLEQMRGFARIMRLGKTQPPEHSQDILVEHTRIVDAIEKRDVVAAQAALARASSPLGLPARAERRVLTRQQTHDDRARRRLRVRPDVRPWRAT